MYIPVKMIDFIAIIKYDKVITRRGEVKMTLFSEKLKLYIEVSSQTIYQLSKKAEVNRTVIHKTISGERVPGNDFLEKLYSALMLSPEEKKELRRLAERARVGEKVYRRREGVRKLILGLSYRPILNTAFTFNTNINEMKRPAEKKEMQILYSREAVIQQVINLLSEAFGSGEKPEICMYLPFSEKEIYEAVYHFYMSVEKEVLLKNLIALEKDYKDDTACLRNLDSLSYVLNFALNDRKGYEPYYFYTGEVQRKTDSVAMPYFLLVNNIMITFDTAVHSAFVYYEKETVDFFKEKIAKLFEGSEAFVKRLDTVLELYGLANGRINELIIEPLPCMGKYMTDERIESLVKKECPMREEAIKMASDFYSTLRAKDCWPVSFFSFEAIEIFMKNGIMPTLPQDIVRPMAKEERYAIINEIIRDSVSEKEPFIAINSHRLKTPVNVEIIKTSKNEIVFRRFNDAGNEQKTLFLCETSMVDAFLDFMKILCSSEYVYSKNEMIKKMQEYVKGGEAKDDTV